LHRDYVADNYWPQAKKASKRVTGVKILELYAKMYSKESSAKSAPSAAAKPVKEEEQVKKEAAVDPDEEDGEIREDKIESKGDKDVKMGTPLKQEQVGA